MSNAMPAEPHDHLVQFYDHESELVELVATYLADGLGTGETAIVVATAAHIAAFADALAALGVDVFGALSSGELLVLDAAETLGRLMTANGPDAQAYEQVIGDLLRRSKRSGRAVRAYGEMVALLWDAEQVVAAIELEKLWNDLAQRVEFTLLCAYPTSSVTGEHQADEFAHVCGLHSRIVTDPTDLRNAVDAPVDSVVREFTATLTAAQAARWFVTETLAGWVDDGEVVADALLVVSELATNAVIHGGSEFVVELSRRSQSVRIAVRDRGLALPAIRSALSTAESGRGLALIAAVARRWGHQNLLDGKLVWVDLHA